MSADLSTATPTATPRGQAAHRARTGARWFYWIAGLTLLNSLLAAFGVEWNLIFGLGIGQVFMALGKGLAADGGGPALVALGLFMSMGALSIYVLWGWLASRGQTLGFVAGMICYGLDAGIFVVAGDWIGAAFHGFALVVIGRGLKAQRELQSLSEEEPGLESEEQWDPVGEIVAAVEDEEQRELVT